MIEMLEVQKTKSTNDILKLNKIVHEFEGTLARKRGKVNEESTLLDRSISDNTDYSDPIANWYSVDISYTPNG